MRSQKEKTYAYLSESLPSLPALSSQLDYCDDLYLESICIPSGAFSKICTDRHLICVNNAQHTRCEIEASGRVRNFLFLTNDLIIIPAKTEFTIQTDYACHTTILGLSSELLTCHAIALWNSDQFALIPSYPIQDLLVTHISRALKAELKVNPNNSNIYAKAMANALAVHLLQNFSNRSDRVPASKRALSDKKLKRILDYIEAHLEQKIALSDLATLIGCSQHRFSHAFKQSIGLSPYQYIIQQRVEQAKQLLKRNNMNICEISVACGFSHQSHLNRHFKRLVGTTPSVFQSAS